MQSALTKYYSIKVIRGNNGIVHGSKIFDFIFYADDTTLSSTLSCFKSNNTINDNINGELNKISEWLKLNKLSLSIKRVNT